MKKVFSVIVIACVICAAAAADTLIWHGKVSSDGTPTPSVKLQIGQKYKIKASGTMNLGKWRTNKQALENDACFEFFANPSYQDRKPTKIDTLKSSVNIDVCDGKYRPDHIYESPPFLSVQSGIHFWIHDTDYEDNSGELDLELFLVKEE